jgi:phosphomannomutase
MRMEALQPPTDYYKYCPGEEHIKISNAICRGRRRASFPKCPGCQFNEDRGPAMVGPTLATAIAAPAASLESIFKADEIRATAPSPLSEDAAWRVGHAAAQYLHGRLRGYERAVSGSRSVVVGRDLRPSAEALQRGLMDGIRSVGMDVINIGVVDTPQVYFAVCRFNACGGVQTTGGVMPAAYNGFTLCGAKGAPLGDQTGLAGIRDIALRVPRHHTGMTARLHVEDTAKAYGEFVRGQLPRGGLKRPLYVIADASHGVAGRWLPRLLDGVPNLTLEMICAEPVEPFAHEPDPCVASNTASLRQRVKQAKADIGVCFSGDANECVFVDEKGWVAGGDLVGALLGRALLERQSRSVGTTIVLDARSSRTASDEIIRAGGIAPRERAGPNNMRKRMAETGAVFGVDLDGRYYFRENAYCESAFLALVYVMNLLDDSGQRLSEMIHPLQKFRSSGQIELRCSRPDELLDRLAEQHREAQLDQVDGITVRYPDWGFHLRPDDSAARAYVTVEARTKKLVAQRLAELTATIEPQKKPEKTADYAD